MESQPSNGQIASHETRLQHLEQATTNLATQIAAFSIKLDRLNEIVEGSGIHLDETLDRVTNAVEKMGREVATQSERIKPLEQTATAHKQRSINIKKAFYALVLAGIGALGGKLATYFVGRF